MRAQIKGLEIKVTVDIKVEEYRDRNEELENATLHLGCDVNLAESDEQVDLRDITSLVKDCLEAQARQQIRSNRNNKKRYNNYNKAKVVQPAKEETSKVTETNEEPKYYIPRPNVQPVK